MKAIYNHLLLNGSASVKDAIKRLDENEEKILFIVNDQNQLEGSLTDGDIRRWILKDGSLRELVSKVCFTGTFYVYQDFNVNDVKNEILQRKISFVPVVDNKKIIYDILDREIIFDEVSTDVIKEQLDIPVVIMAGGKGTRLDPFTKILPKPLIPIGDKTILEIIVENFLNFGITDFTFTVNYKANIIKSYFEEVAPNWDLKYIDENIPLGTAGSLRLFDTNGHRDVFVTNCDIIINTDYADLINFHKKDNNDITIVASIKHIRIPYGVCKLSSEGLLDSIDEKPEFDYLVSTGMYVVNTELFKLIPCDKVYHMTDLVEDVKKLGKRVAIYPISENSWTDIGEWAEYNKAVGRLLQ